VKVWVTRAQPGADRTAVRLRPLGFEPLVAPLLAVRELPGADFDLHGVGALAFTSANGVAAFAARQPDGRALPVFAVGAATAAAARAAGFDRVRSAGGDVEDLAALIARSGVEGAVLHPCAEAPAGDLPGALRRGGIAVRPVPAYRTEILPLPDEAARAWTDLHAVLVHSPRAGRALAAALADLPPGGPPAACISAAAAAPLRGLSPEVRWAARPDEASLLSLLGKPPPPG
jgi:uroporphyrinogen-III synthase